MGSNKGDSVLKVTLPDGAVLDVSDGASPYEVAETIGPRLAKAAVAGQVFHDGYAEIIDLNRPIPGSCKIAILTKDDENADSLYVLRHSTAHVMAEAICKLFPSAKLAYGPPVEDGFYYDIDLDRSITPDDFDAIEAEMARIIKEDRPFTRYEMSRSDAMPKLAKEGNRYKVDNAERAEGDTLSFYITGQNKGQDFEDLCRGPHVPSTGVIGAFKVRQVSASYYRGDANEKSLQRVYGTAFFKKKALTEYLERLEEAKKRDHRVLGKELGLFTINQKVGSGLILWMPKGSIIRSELQEFLSDEMVKLGYFPVYSPHIGNLDLYRTSGHYPYYQDSQFPPLLETTRGTALHCLEMMVRRLPELAGKERESHEQDTRAYAKALTSIWGDIEGLDINGAAAEWESAVADAMKGEVGFLLKPMNCPHHIQIYAAQPRSYRDLPLRLAEFGTVYRFEQSGELSGMTRVRGFTQDDAHLFCTAEQLPEELLTTVELTRKVLETLELNDYRVRLGLRDPDSSKYVGDAENWDKAEAAIRAAVKEADIEYSEEQGEAAFYGPKIDFVVKDCIGREWQLGTVQVDYNLPERFDLHYVGADNSPHRPIMIHRAPFGSMERFIGILIEHFAGAFPLWLAPVQVAIATVSEKSVAYGKKVAAALRDAGLRVELDVSDEKIGPKKHRLRASKVPYIVVIGEQEAAEGMLNVNPRGGSMTNESVQDFLDRCRDEIESKHTGRYEHSSR